MLQRLHLFLERMTIVYHYQQIIPFEKLGLIREFAHFSLKIQIKMTANTPLPGFYLKDFYFAIVINVIENPC